MTNEEKLDACATECLGLRQMASDQHRVIEDLCSKGHRLAMLLECILLASDSDLAAVSKYWNEAHEALEEWKK